MCVVILTIDLNFHLWYHVVDNSTVCNHGDVRLANHVTEGSGRVEVCIGGKWGNICGGGTDRVAQVICRQLGYSSQGVHFFPGLSSLSRTVAHLLLPSF